MPKWECIEDASPEAERVWLTRIKDIDVWKPLRKTDCQALNANRAAAAAEPVFIECGRAAADPSSGTIRYNFFRGPERKLTCATWFRKEEKSSREIILHPIMNEGDSAKIEALYKKAVEASASLGQGISTVLTIEVELSDESIVKVVKVGDSIMMKKIPKGWFTAQQDLQRGYGEYEIEGEANEIMLGPVRHLVFVIHGIGEALFSREDVKFPSLVEQMNTTRIAIQAKQIAKWKKGCSDAQKAGEPLPPPPDRFELLPIEWFEQLHDSSSSLMRSLKSATLNSIPALRAIANDVVFDVLMYLTPAFCERVLECVTMQINELYSKFQQVHPDFVASGGKCSIIGHSLGSVIAWDLLAVLKTTLEPKTEPSKEDGSFGLPFDLCGVSVQSSDSVEMGYQAYAREELADTARKGTWGPSLTKYMDLKIPFVPETTILLGSPLGIFLTLRGAHAVFDEMRKNHVEKQQQSSTDSEVSAETTEVWASPFTLPTKSLYNIFHPSDPVAYRIEPLLLAQDIPEREVPPPLYLTPPGADLRFHVKAKQIGDEIRKSLLDQKSTWNALIESAVSVLSSDSKKSQSQALTRHTPKEEPRSFPLGGKSPRVDYSIQPGVIDNEYVSAVTAHSSYFYNSDFQDFLISVLKEGRDQESNKS